MEEVNEDTKENKNSLELIILNDFYFNKLLVSFDELYVNEVSFL